MVQIVAGLTLEEWAELPVTWVEVDRVQYDAGAICHALVREMLKFPNNRPIWVKRRGELLIVVDGKHRVEWCKTLGRPFSPAKVA